MPMLEYQGPAPRPHIESTAPTNFEGLSPFVTPLHTASASTTAQELVTDSSDNFRGLSTPPHTASASTTAQELVTEGSDAFGGLSTSPHPPTAQGPSPPPVRINNGSPPPVRIKRQRKQLKEYPVIEDWMDSVVKWASLHLHRAAGSPTRVNSKVTHKNMMRMSQKHLEDIANCLGAQDGVWHQNFHNFLLQFEAYNRE